jgi:DNA-binding NarL/FixJ family response regulator
LVAAGHTNGQIARKLNISAGTVRIHLQNVCGLLQVSSRTTAITPRVRRSRRALTCPRAWPADGRERLLGFG